MRVQSRKAQQVLWTKVKGKKKDYFIKNIFTPTVFKQSI